METALLTDTLRPRLGNCCLSISCCVSNILKLVRSGNSRDKMAAMMERPPAKAGPVVFWKSSLSLMVTPTMVPILAVAHKNPRQWILSNMFHF